MTIMRGVAALLVLLRAGSPHGAPRDPTTPPRAGEPTQSAPVASRVNVELLVSPAQLRARLGFGDLVLLHVGERADYETAHIPGALFLPYDAFDASGSGFTLELPAADALEATLESLGVSDRSRIVLYWGKDWYSPTTRVFFTLDYLGLGDRTAILDGGFAAWVAAGGPVTRAIPRPARGSLTVHPRPGVLAGAATVRAAVGDARVAIIDARDSRFYAGTAAAMHGRRGHVPGARNLPFTALLDPRGGFKPAAELERLLDAAGAGQGKRIIGYCHIGQQATVIYFAARLLGRDVLLYDGSWDEWSARADLPVETHGTPRWR